jgi:hypothetical protein
MHGEKQKKTPLAGIKDLVSHKLAGEAVDRSRCRKSPRWAEIRVVLID